MKRGLLLAVVALAACDSGGGQAAAPTTCTESKTCAAGQLCLGGACAPLYPRTYILTVESAGLASYGSDGLPWDADGPPDPFAVVLANGAEVCRTPPAVDQADPVWDHDCPIVLDTGSELTLQVFDQDPGGQDTQVLLTTLAAADLADLLRLGSAAPQNSLAKLHLAVVPK